MVKRYGKCFTAEIPVHVLEYTLDKEDVHERNAPLLEHEKSGIKLRIGSNTKKKVFEKDAKQFRRK